RHTRSKRDWSSDVCSSDLGRLAQTEFTSYALENFPTSRSIYLSLLPAKSFHSGHWRRNPDGASAWPAMANRSRTFRMNSRNRTRSEERRVGKECKSKWSMV